MVIKIELNRDKCIGCACCAAICSNFQMSNDGKAKIKKDSLNELGCNEEAARVCPVQCINIVK